MQQMQCKGMLQGCVGGWGAWTSAYQCCWGVFYAPPSRNLLMGNTLMSSKRDEKQEKDIFFPQIRKSTFYWMHNNLGNLVSL